MSKTPQKLREYQGLWLEIARKADPDKHVSITCHASFSRRLIQAVRKEKTAANILRKNLGMPRYGRLMHTIEPLLDSKGKVRISFHLEYNGDML
jgi:hypothetical protein